MKKKLALLLIALMTAMLLVSCGGSGGEEITLKLSYGERTGTYEGDMKDGVPHGMGKFSSQNDQGDKWTYEGEFKNGHFDGEGTTTWDDGNKEIGTYKNDEIVPLKGKNIKKVYSDPGSYKDYCVEITGQVFGGVDYDDGIIALQMWGDPVNNDRNTIVYIYDEDFEVEDGDYLKIKGIIAGEFKGENMMGGKISALEVDAVEAEVIDYIEAVAPANKTVEVNQTVNQKGYSVTVQKIEYADTETRVYMQVNNGGAEKFSFYTYDAKLVQGNKQYEEQDNWDADYGGFNTEISVGVTLDGIVAFPAIEDGPFYLEFEGHSDDWMEDLQPYVFNVEP